MSQILQLPTLVVIIIMCASVSCSQVGLKHSKAILKSEQTEAVASDPSNQNTTSSEPLVREPADSSNEMVSPPANISGSYLICAEAKAATAESPEAIVNCGLRDQVTSSKIDISSFTTKTWTYQVEGADSMTAFSAELPTSPEWHAAITLKASSLGEIQSAQKSIKIFLTVGDATGNKFREVSSLSLNCSRLAGGTWIAVPGDSIYGTNAFCVQKYQAANTGNVPTSQAGLVPWGNTSQTTALSACASLGKGYRLITNPEWMSLAANLANVGSNWSNGAVGAGTLRRGHSDNNPNRACAANADDANAYVETDCTGSSTGTFLERRTSTLSNASVIWDIGGNLWNWVDYFNDADKPTPAEALYYEYNVITGTASTPKAQLVPLNSVQPWWTDRWGSQQGIGRIHPGPNGSGGAMLRGLFWNGGVNSGAFAAGLFDNKLTTNLAFGFRCTWQP